MVEPVEATTESEFFANIDGRVEIIERLFHGAMLKVVLCKLLWSVALQHVAPTAHLTNTRTGGHNAAIQEPNHAHSHRIQ
jgi:hypothetical protein